MFGLDLEPLSALHATGAGFAYNFGRIFAAVLSVRFIPETRGLPLDR